ncbi:MAG: BamA/TamA family outer membrane protein [Cryomorphaceae bacterium]|nr:BamA/TamA family outer membrane protein [Cryomorphaceae bacterium]
MHRQQTQSLVFLRIKKTIYACLSLLLIGFLLSSCRSVRQVQPGDRALWETTLLINGKKSNNREAWAVIRQQPAPRKLFGYKPVIVDTALAIRSAQQLQQFAINQGYFRANAHYTYEETGDKRAAITYHIETGPRFFIKNIDYEIDDAQLNRLQERTSGRRRISTGNPFVLSEMEAERERLTTLFRNNGYFGFPRDRIRFTIDTLSEPLQIDLKILIPNPRERVGDSLVSKPPVPNIISQIVINPDYRIRNKKADTVNFLGYNLLYENKDSIWIAPRVLTDVLEFSSGSTYRENRIKNSYQHINRLRMFSSTEINFRADESDTTGRNIVANISLIPLPRRSFTAEVEALTTAAQLGTNANIGWINRNAFGGGENLSVRLRGGIESQAIGELATDQFFNTFELSAEASLLFPRFLLPFNTIGIIPKRMQPRTRMLLSAGRQSRVEFDRILYRGTLGYIWQQDLEQTHMIDLFDVNVVQISQLRDEFLQNLNFLFGFRNTFISSTRYTYTYNNQLTSNKPLKFFFRGMVEVAGNTLSAMDAVSGFPTDSLGAGEVLGINYAQYIKAEIDYRQFWRLTPKSTLVWRAFFGYTRAYGNSIDPVFGYQPPFEKRYFAGGNNDIRAFLPYRLGPGNNQGADTLFNTAPIKLMTNLEYRFPVYQKFKGAVFLDAGNIYYENLRLPDGSRVADENPEYVLRWETLLESLALGSGVGIRYDFGFFVVRLDAAYPLYNPNEPVGNRFITDDLRFSRIAWNVALGYPF